MSFFFSFLSFSFKLRERERERVYKIWYKEKQSQGYLSYFFDGVPWRIFLLLRANRLYAIFKHWLEGLGSLVSEMFFCLLLPGELALVHLPATNPVQRLTFLFSIFADGKESPTSVLGSQPIVWLLPFSLPVSGDPSEVTKYKHLWVSPLWPAFFLNGHSLMACYC